MDERKKQISVLEQRKRENTAALDVLLVHFGESLFKRTLSCPEENPCASELSEFRRLHKDKGDSEAAIGAVEEQIDCQREVEAAIETQEQEEKACSKELSGLYGELGKLLLDSPASGGLYSDFTAAWRERADSLYTKVHSLEERLSELGHREGGNVFEWIGKNAQGLVTRSFLGKAQESLEQLYRTVGERFSKNSTPIRDAGEGGALSPLDEGIAELFNNIEQKRNMFRALLEDLMKLREERRRISDGFSAEGGPLKQIQHLKNHISTVNDEFRALYRRFGVLAAGLEEAGVPDVAQLEERKRFTESLLTEADNETLGSAARFKRLVTDDENAIGRLKASLAIDDEQAHIENYRKKIADKQARIREAEKTIAEFETAITASEQHIEELRQIIETTH